MDRCAAIVAVPGGSTYENTPLRSMSWLSWTEYGHMKLAMSGSSGIVVVDRLVDVRERRDARAMLGIAVVAVVGDVDDEIDPADVLRERARVDEQGLAVVVHAVLAAVVGGSSFGGLVTMWR